MIVIEVDKKQVKIPQSYSELTLNEFCAIWKILCKYNLDKPPTEDEEIDAYVNDEINLTKELVAKLLGLSPKDVDRIEYTQAQEIINIFNNMLDQNDFDGDWSEHNFKHKGETYYFPKYNFEGMSFGEYASLKQYEQVLINDNDKRFDILANQIAYCCRKKNEKKESYNIEERAELFKDITMDTVMKLTFFLQKRISSLQKLTQIYSDKQKKTEQQQRLDTSLQDLGGSTQSTE